MRGNWRTTALQKTIDAHQPITDESDWLPKWILKGHFFLTRDATTNMKEFTYNDSCTVDEGRVPEKRNEEWWPNGAPGTEYINAESMSEELDWIMEQILFDFAVGRIRFRGATRGSGRDIKLTEKAFFLQLLKCSTNSALEHCRHAHFRDGDVNLRK